MTIQQAAESLAQLLQGSPWLTGVAVGEREGEPCIFVYVNSAKQADVGFLRGGWQGFPVEIKRLGTLRPLGKPLAS